MSYVAPPLVTSQPMRRRETRAKVVYYCDISPTCATFGSTSQPTPQRRSPAQWSTGDSTTATSCFTARRPWISTSCSEFRTLLLASSPDLDALNMRCPYSPNYTGCRPNTEYNTRLSLQCSRSWQHNSRATWPTSSGFVLLHANFGSAEGICYMTIIPI